MNIIIYKNSTFAKTKNILLNNLSLKLNLNNNTFILFIFSKIEFFFYFFVGKLPLKSSKIKFYIMLYSKIN
jgi:hypothetical protein